MRLRAPGGRAGGRHRHRRGRRCRFGWTRGRILPVRRRGLGGGSASFGTVSSISGKTLYVTDTSGNTIKVTLSPATKVTKSVGVSAKSVHPGDTVVVSGIKGSGGTVQAATVSDSGARASSSGASGAGGSGALELPLGRRELGRRLAVRFRRLMQCKRRKDPGS